MKDGLPLLRLGHCFSQCSPKKQKRGIGGGGGESDSFKELAHAVIETSKSRIQRVGQQAGDPGKSCCCSESPKAVYWHNSCLLKRGQSFVTFRLSTS